MTVEYLVALMTGTVIAGSFCKCGLLSVEVLFVLMTLTVIAILNLCLGAACGC